MQAYISFLSWGVAILLIQTSFSAATNPEEMKKLKEAMEKSAREQGIDPNNLKPGETFMMPPEMTDEEEGSRHMPRSHRCDGCRAAAYQLEKAFTAAEKRVKKGARLPMADILDVTEIVCEKKFRNYGLKNINGKKKLSGEGLEADTQPGIMEGGGKWEVRLKTLCSELIEEYEEDGMYEKFRDRGDNKLEISLCSSYCSEEEIENLKQGKSRDEL